jgi:hypothetical protein
LIIKGLIDICNVPLNVPLFKNRNDENLNKVKSIKRLTGFPLIETIPPVFDDFFGKNALDRLGQSQFLKMP